MQVVCTGLYEAVGRRTELDVGQNHDITEATGRVCAHVGAFLYAHLCRYSSVLRAAKLK